MSGGRLDHHMLAIAILALSITVILCSVEDVYFSHLSVDRENRFELWDYYVLRQAGNLFSVLGCAVVLMLASRRCAGHRAADGAGGAGRPGGAYAP